MARCFSDRSKGIAFVDRGRIYAYKLDEWSHGAIEEEIMPHLERLFKKHPSWRAAFENVEVANIFCWTCGYWCMDNRDGLLVCAECGEQAREGYQGPLVPEVLMEAIRGERGDDEEDRAGDDHGREDRAGPSAD